jgi:threonine/homoserine/homoserine lactone efflux protein
MDLIPLLIKGIIVGIIVAAPMGPVNIIVIQRRITRGSISALITGSGGAIGDGVFAIIAALGLTAARHFVEDNEFWFRLPGGLFMLVLSVLVWRKHPHMDAQDDTTGLVRSVFTTFFLTISNPITVAGFAALFVAFGLTTGFDYIAASAVVIGVIAGSMLWWLIVVSVVGLLHNHIEDRHLVIFNRYAAVAVFLFGLYAIDSVTTGFLDALIA